jgi:hypothetical protein
MQTSVIGRVNKLPECEGGTYSRLVLHLHAVAVGFGQFLAVGQSQPDAFDFGGEERFKEFLHVLLHLRLESKILNSPSNPVQRTETWPELSRRKVA